ncbi:heme-binding protein [Luteibacter sp. ME-Dv--P-043b]|uniref:GlcG/HbpS family heme-binding protein n=1 Tax=Luteibacter sp. ME-Dv--P-043b TaxID=3040291 RepID=UPI002554BE1A|nr:heme-binding protein [Luteibacter sp. ME-Dv--P-043b]
MRQQWHVDFSEATAILQAAVAHANTLGVPVSVVVLDGGGHLVAASRLDEASFQVFEVASAKALGSVMMRAPSKALEDAALARPTLATFNDGRLSIQGAVPLMVKGQCVGAVGVSGGTPDQDEACAKAGAAALPASSP